MRVKTDYIDYDKVDEKTRASMDRLFSAPRRGYWARKRAFDIIVSLIMLLLLVPLFIVVSIVIVIDDPHAGPIFKQQRVGRHGVEFSMYKFRTWWRTPSSSRTGCEAKTRWTVRCSR